MKTKRARPQVTSNPGTMVFHDRAALQTLRSFPDRRNGISLALETLTDTDWSIEIFDYSDRRRYVPIKPDGPWHPFELEPVQIEIANTDPEQFIGILCALLKGWWPSQEEHVIIRKVHEYLQSLTGKGWTHNHVQGPEVGVVFAAPGGDGRVMFLSKTQIDDGIGRTVDVHRLVREKLAGEHPAVFDQGLIPEPDPFEVDLQNEPGVLPDFRTPPLAAAAADREAADHRLKIAELEQQVDIVKADTLFTKDEGEAILRTAGARMERNGLVLAKVNQHGRTAIEQELSEHVAQDRMPAGLVVDDDNGLLNWEGVNYIKQTLLQEYQQAAQQVGHKQASELTELRTENSQKDARITELERVLHASDVQIERLKTEYAKLLQARETIDPTAEFTYERDRAEAVELVESMLAGAGFTMLRDGADGSGAMWMQKLESRSGVQVFLQVPEAVLASGPATVFAYVKQNVGVSL